MANYNLGGRSIRVSPAKAIGKGGEADVYDIGGGKALKIYKMPNHPDYDGEPLAQKAAQLRIAERQRKLRDFPTTLPSRVITPGDLATDPKTGLIVGFDMRFLKGADVIARLRQHDFRSTVDGNAIIKIFRGLHETVTAIHKNGVIIGDFNDLNIMLLGDEAFLIDADSFQFGPYFCGTYTQRFADPTLCDPAQTQLVLSSPHTAQSDWYAFSAMLLQSLVRVDPYGGVYRPTSGKPIPQAARPLQRITIFHPQVGYPKSALPLDYLPDEMLQYLHTVFMKDHRGEFPLKILEGTRWTKCTACGIEHARRTCPNCAIPAPAVVERVRGNVHAKRVFFTGGQIVYADYQNGQIKYLYHSDGALKRETGMVVLQGDVKPHMRFRILGDTTLIGNGNVVIQYGKTPGDETKYVVDTYGTLPMFDTDSGRLLIAQNGRLLIDERFGTETIGTFLEGQTMFWTGNGHGFGFYRAGELFRAFVFEHRRKSLNDLVDLPRIKGQLIDATAVLSEKLTWFFTTRRDNQKVINQCTVIDRLGAVLGSAEAEEGDGSWLGTLRGKCAVGPFLLAATDDGLVRVEVDGKDLVVTKEFLDTKGFVHSGNHIVPGKGGLYAIGANEIVHVTMS